MGCPETHFAFRRAINFPMLIAALALMFSQPPARPEYYPSGMLKTIFYYTFGMHDDCWKRVVVRSPGARDAKSELINTIV
jgi:hypothetical protein